MKRGLLLTVVWMAALAAPAQAAVTFNPARQFAAAPGPTTLATADFNGDGIVDVASAGGPGVLAVSLGKGDGTFQPPINAPTAGAAINSVAAGDVNGDGRADAVAAINGSPGAARVYLGNGDGTFAAAVNYSVGNFPQDVVLGRINGDAALDIAVANQTSDNVTILLNSGTGTFAPSPGSPVSTGTSEAHGVALADFNRDGRTDLAIAAINGSTPGTAVRPGDGAGSFGAAAVAPAGGATQKLAAGDLDGDGFADLVASRPSSGDLEVFRNGAGGLQSPTTINPDGGGGNQGQPTLADLDGDGVLDLAVPYYAGSQANKIGVLTGRGDTTFATGSFEPTAAQPFDVTAADLNGDGHPDLVAPGTTGNNISVLTAIPPTVSITTPIEFGTQQQDTTSAERTITVRNNGIPRLHVGSVSLGGLEPDEFSISSNTCRAANLPAGEACTVGVRFTPAAAGPRGASVTITSDAGGAPHAAELRGTGALLRGACANVLNGTRLGETLTGTARGDNIFAFGGNDVVSGLAGNDCIHGGGGKDKLTGDAGNDTVAGGSGNDQEAGGAGRDTLRGGAGQDSLTGNSGNDLVYGSTGNDRLSGGTGNDTLIGGAGNDRIDGDSGNDTLIGGAGNDRIDGGSGRNSYRGGAGNDVISAANGRTERVDCGPGHHDRASVDHSDRVRHCESVSRR